jgi:hypothetical protein
MYIQHKYILHRADFVFSQSLLCYQRIFFNLRVRHCETLCRSVGALHAAAFLLVVVSKTASSECILKGSKKVEVGGC